MVEIQVHVHAEVQVEILMQALTFSYVTGCATGA
jgi:hypothetical protein